jgi:GDP-L-fucose synthase
MNKDDQILVLGGNGLLGSAIVRTLTNQGYTNILIVSRSTGLDLLNSESVLNYFNLNKPKYIFMTAGLVGGIVGNKKRNADFLYENTLMILNLLNALKTYNNKAKLLYTGSTCIYPKENPQPINEERFLSGKLEESNKGYAIAKITGIVACQLYKAQYGLETVCVMPTNLYGPGDNYNLETGHMIPSLIQKFVNAKKNSSEVTLWGSGTPRREALFSEDCAAACIYLMKNYSGDEIINIGTGFDYSIKEFASMISEVVKYDAQVKWDSSKPDGTFEKRTDITRLLKIMPNFKPRSFKDGLKIVLEKDFSL